MAKTAVVWGHKLHSHTHSYVHEGFARAFAYLGYDVHWLDDSDDVSGVDFRGALFVTEGQVDRRIPIRDDCKYVLHNCDAARYAAVAGNCLKLQVYCARNIRSARFDRVGPAAYYADGILFQPWATDLLPHEICLDCASWQRERVSYWIGTIGSGRFGNVGELEGYQRACQEGGVTFMQRGSVSRDTHIGFIQRSSLAPAITGTWQLGEGYIPCRIFKNISYGQLGVTNSAAVNELFDDQLVCNPDTYQLFADGQDALRRPGSVTRVRELMQTVRETHTFVHRINTILQVLP
jgi:hypothetical protein